MNKLKDLFDDCRAPMLYDSLPAMEQNAAHDGADEFFDAPSTPLKPESSQRDEFFTPHAQLPERNEAAKVLLSPIREISESNVSQDEDRRKSNIDLPQGRIILKAKRRSLQLQQKTECDVDRQDIERLADRVFEGIRLDSHLPEKEHQMITRQDVVVKTPILALRNRCVVRAQLKRNRMPSPFSKNQPATKYVALAEQIQHFFLDTPPRFRRSVKPKMGPSEILNSEKNDKPKVTVPQSPFLLTKDRHRAHSPPPMPEENHIIKALPLNPKVFQAPDPNSRPPSKPSTVLQPFNLTEMPKKSEQKPVEIQDVIQFKARPAPRSTRQSMMSVCSSNSSVKVVRVPVYNVKKDSTVSLNIDNAHTGVYSDCHEKKNVKVEPFSFDMRDRIARQQKERKIQQMIEESTRIPKFTARPVPSFISNTTILESRKSTVSEGHNTERCCGIEGSQPKGSFKAKPPTVLFKEPFVPKKAEKPLTDITEFQLNTERRARERAMSELSLKEQEKAMELLKKEFAAQQALQEKQEIEKLRKSMVPKPTPLPAYLNTASSKSQ